MHNKEFVNYIIELLSPYGNIRARAMFGGYGIYKGDAIVAIIVDGELYFKTDKTTANKYEAAGSCPFSYHGKKGLVQVSYWQVPEIVMEDTHTLGQWLEEAYKVSVSSKKLSP